MECIFTAIAADEFAGFAAGNTHVAVLIVLFKIVRAGARGYRDANERG
jgi:hypothetical protein